jgi:hypothetical protein
MTADLKPSAPEVVLIKREAWTSERHHVREEFEVRGGDVAPEWAVGLRPPLAPWCAITLWDEGHVVSGYGGEVWPSAWPNMFRIDGPPGRQTMLLTDAGAAAFSAARERGTVRS